jgi:hypothetical protein
MSRRIVMDDELYEGGCRVRDDTPFPANPFNRVWARNARIRQVPPNPHHPEADLRDMFTAEVVYDRWKAVAHRRDPARALAAAFDALADLVRRNAP